MFKGAVNFRARIKGNGLKFPLVEFNPNETGVEKVEIEGPKGDEIQMTVYLASAASPEEGKALAAKVNTAVLNRICFRHGIAIENARSTGDRFSPLDPQPGELEIAPGNNLSTGGTPDAVVSIQASRLKDELELPTSIRETYFGLFRSALQSLSPVEEFMHLYHILLMIYSDKQEDVDWFIYSEDPSVPQTQSPGKGIMETVYTRLRNEFGHRRVGVNRDDTKSEMAARLGGLIGLTQRAIELNP